MMKKNANLEIDKFFLRNRENFLTTSEKFVTM